MTASTRTIITAALAAIRHEYVDGSHLGIRYAAGVPPTADLLAADQQTQRDRVAEAGARALRVYAERVQAVTEAVVRSGLYVLALLPAAGCPGWSRDSGTGAGDAPAEVAAFAVTALGLDTNARVDVTPELLDTLPSAWQDALTALTCLLRLLARGGAQRPVYPPQAGTAVARLALLALSRGLVAPDASVPWSAVRRWARAAGWSTRGIRNWRRALLGGERALAWWCASDASSPASDAQRAATAALRDWLAAFREAYEIDGPRGLRATLERLGRPVPPRVSREPGTTADPDAVRLGLGAVEQDQLALLRVVAPHVVPLVLAPRAGTRKRGGVTAIHAGTTSNLLSALDRLLAQFVRSFPERSTEALHPADLLTERVPAAALRVPLPDQDGQLWVERGLGHAVDAPTVPLLRYLFDCQLESSRAHSPQVRRETAGDATPSSPAAVGYTQSLVKEARTFAHALRRAVSWRTSDRTASRAELEALIATADDVAAGMEATLGPQPERPKVKDVRKLMHYVTWPQLLCVGLPRFRAYVHALRDATRRRPRFDEPVVDVGTYEYYLELYVLLAVFAIDPLRIKNWRFGRLGHEVQLTPDPQTGALTILGVHTHVTGAGDDDYTLCEVKNANDREFDWPPDAVDLTLFGEYLTRVRARRAAYYAGPRYADPAGEIYGEIPRLPLFLAPPRRGTPTVAADVLPPAVVANAVALGEDLMRKRFAEALHWVVR
ncbi:MAG TPA: hypothetical protein VGD56_06575 [Gemmatirosa sp.]